MCIHWWSKIVDDKTHELAVLKAQAKIRLEELKAQDSAKEVAGKAIGEDGLLYIFLIVLVGVGELDCDL